MNKTVVLAALALSTFAATANAETRYLSKVPNAGTRCVTCHEGSLGDEPWNAFGDTLFTENGGTAEDDDTINGDDPLFKFWDATICNTDSDADGQTNGQELGDPNCVWTKTTPATIPARTTDISNPGDPDSKALDPARVDAGEGEGEEGEGEVAGEGEGEDEDDAPKCDARGPASGSTAPALVVVGALLLAARRRR